MGFRISTMAMYNTAVKRMMTNLTKVNQAQEELSTGKKIRRPHDNPAVIARGVSNRSVLNAVGQYQRNISFSEGYLVEVESAIQGISNLLSRASELAIKGANDVVGSDEIMAGLSTEVSGLYDEALALGNATWSGGKETGARYMFSGFLSDIPSFDATGTYQGDTGEFQVEIGLQEWVTVGFAGSQLFQGDIDMFAVLGDLRDYLAANDTDGVATCIDDLNLCRGQITKDLAEVGVRVNRLESTEERLEQITISLQDFLVQEEDADIVESASKLTFYQTVLEASFRASQRVFDSFQII